MRWNWNSLQPSQHGMFFALEYAVEHESGQMSATMQAAFERQEAGRRMSPMKKALEKRSVTLDMYALGEGRTWRSDG
jgi:hypothetical protein